MKPLAQEQTSLAHAPDRVGPVVFLHGRPGPHPFHAKLARCVGADLLPVDFCLRWHDRRTPRVYRYASWLICALRFPNRARYQVFLTEGPHFPPAIMRRLGLLGPDQRLACLVANETLFFLRERRYPQRTRRAILWLLQTYDSLICVGRMQTELASDLLPRTRRPLVLTIPSAVPQHRRAALLQVRPSLNAANVLFIGNVPQGWRWWYKGLDLTMSAVSIASRSIPGLKLDVVGYCEPPCSSTCDGHSGQIPGCVRFLGFMTDLQPALSQASLYVHMGRGDAFGISVLEAMCAGIPAIVSEWTGAREAVEQVDPRLVVSLDANMAAERICWYMGLPLIEKQRLSDRSREVAATYTEERAIAEFRAAIAQVCALGS